MVGHFYVVSNLVHIFVYDYYRAYLSTMCRRDAHGNHLLCVGAVAVEE